MYYNCTEESNLMQSGWYLETRSYQRMSTTVACLAFLQRDFPGQLLCHRKVLEPPGILIHPDPMGFGSRQDHIRNQQ